MFKERRDLVVSMLNQANGHRLPDAGRRVLRLSVLRRHDRQDRAVGQDASTTDEDFVTELLEAEGVAVVQGAAFGLGPAFRISYATSTADARGSLPAHPALLRQLREHSRGLHLRGASSIVADHSNGWCGDTGEQHDFVSCFVPPCVVVFITF